MKKIVITTMLFLCIPVLSLAEPYASIEVGYTQESADFFTNVIVGLSCPRLDVNINIETQMDQHTLLSYQPYRNTYGIGLDVFVARWLTLRAEHYCTHPVFSEREQFFNKWFGESRTRFSIKLQTK